MIETEKISIREILEDIIIEYGIYQDQDYMYSASEFVELYLKNKLPRPIDIEISEYLKNNEIK